MKKLLLIVLLIPILVLSQPNNECYRSSNKQFKDSVIQIMFTLVNEHRVSHNLNELEWCNILQKSCLSHSKYQGYDGGVCGHYEDDKKNPYYTGPNSWDRTNIDGTLENALVRYDFNGIDANPWMNRTLKIRNANELANEMFTQWKTSSGHNENMLDKNWNYFAFDYYGYDDNRAKYYDLFNATQLFRN